MRAELYDLYGYQATAPQKYQVANSTARQRYWAELDLAALTHNFQVTQSLVPGARLLCVLKDDSYGLGSVAIAKALIKAGATYFAVATAEEALQLRRDGIGATPILVLGMVGPEWIPTLAAQGVTVAIGGITSAREYAQRLAPGQTLKVHIGIDTGMNRIGFKPVEAVARIKEVLTFDKFLVEGIFTHFAAAEDDKQIDFTLQQVDRFDQVMQALAEEEIDIPLKHYANSAAIASFDNMIYKRSKGYINAARPGIILYGVNPYPSRLLDLRPVLSLKARIMKIKTVKKGETVSYNRIWTAPRDSVIATIGVGYGDGYLRSFSNKVEVLVGGRRAPQVGRICMDQCMLDITNLPDVKVGDTVTLLGTDHGERITFSELAERGGVIAAEIMHAVGKRISRVYVKDDEVVEQFCYLDYL